MKKQSTSKIKLKICVALLWGRSTSGIKAVKPATAAHINISKKTKLKKCAKTNPQTKPIIKCRSEFRISPGFKN
jgi:hypothetical protein